MAKDLFIDLLYVEKVTDDKRTDNQFKELLNGFKKEYPITTPNYEIDLRATDTAAIIRLANTTTGYTNTDGSWLYQGGANLLLRNREAGGIHFYTSDTDRGRIDSAGNMILGGTTPTTGLKLDVEGNVGAVLYCDETAANCFDAANVVTSATSTGTVGFWFTG